MNNLKELRKCKNKKLKEVAESVGISESQLSFYEHGKRQPKDKETWRKLANYYNVSIPYVMGLEVAIGDMITISKDEYTRLKDAEEQLNNIKQILK